MLLRSRTGHPCGRRIGFVYVLVRSTLAIGLTSCRRCVAMIQQGSAQQNVQQLKRTKINLISWPMLATRNRLAKSIRTSVSVRSSMGSEVSAMPLPSERALIQLRKQMISPIITREVSFEPKGQVCKE